MSKLKYYDGTEWKTVNGQITGDTLPIGSEVDFDGETVPVGWQEIDNPDAYSTSEIKTNKVWIDGKPIYRKVIDCGTLPDNTIKNVAHSISNLSYVIFANGISYSSETGNYFPIPYSADSLQAQVKMWVTNTDVYLQTISNRSNYTITYIILEYTKTTD